MEKKITVTAKIGAKTTGQETTVKKNFMTEVPENLADIQAIADGIAKDIDRRAFEIAVVSGVVSTAKINARARYNEGETHSFLESVLPVRTEGKAARLARVNESRKSLISDLLAGKIDQEKAAERNAELDALEAEITANNE